MIEPERQRSNTGTTATSSNNESQTRSASSSTASGGGVIISSNGTNSDSTNIYNTLTVGWLFDKVISELSADPELANFAMAFHPL